MTRTARSGTMPRCCPCPDAKVRARRLTRCRIALAAAPLLAGSACVSTPPHAGLAAAAPAFSPGDFFAGGTVGDGVLRIALSHPRRVRVTGDGHVESDGTLVLVQRVEEGSRPARTRIWHLHPLTGGRFAGTLSDASGPVAADVRGNRLHVRFTAKGGLGIEQWLYLQPGGQSALNHLVVRKLGIRIAVLRETIRRAP